MRLRLATIVISVVLAALPQADAADRAVVLVTSGECGMDQISALDIRKAYLGVGVSYEGQSIRPFRLNNDEKLNQIFYQSVVAMSEKTYERRLLLLLIKYGRPRPQHYESADELAAAVAETPCSIAYMWQSDAQVWADIKAIKVLWQEN